MSKGRRILTFRISEEMHGDVIRLVERRNSTTREEPWTMTDFVLRAIAEKIAHVERSRAPKRKKERGEK